MEFDDDLRVTGEHTDDYIVADCGESTFTEKIKMMSKIVEKKSISHEKTMLFEYCDIYPSIDKMYGILNIQNCNDTQENITVFFKSIKYIFEGKCLLIYFLTP